MKKIAKWLVQKLLAKRKQEELWRWLIHDENLIPIEKMVYICEP
jgi:hypothetical protein